MQSNTSKIVLAIIVTAIIVGGGVYYWQQYQAGQSTANELTKAEEENNKLHYKNDTYGFSLDFPETWRNYTITKSDRNRAADLPAVASFKYSLDEVVFTITVYTKEQFTALTKAYPNGTPHTYNGKMAENDSFVFTAYGDQDAETSGYPRTDDVAGIIETLKLTTSASQNSNEFSLSDLKIGLKVGELKVASFGPFDTTTGPMTINNLRVSFEGMMTVSGKYSPAENLSMVGKASFSLDDASMLIFPKLASDAVAKEWFVFNDSNTDIVAKLGKVSRQATIVVKNYTLVRFPSEVSSLADLVEVK